MHEAITLARLPHGGSAHGRPRPHLTSPVRHRDGRANSQPRDAPRNAACGARSICDSELSLSVAWPVRQARHLPEGHSERVDRWHVPSARGQTLGSDPPPPPVRPDAHTRPTLPSANRMATRMPPAVATAVWYTRVVLARCWHDPIPVPMPDDVPSNASSITSSNTIGTKLGTSNS